MALAPQPEKNQRQDRPPSRIHIWTGVDALCCRNLKGVRLVGGRVNVKRVGPSAAITQSPTIGKEALTRLFAAQLFRGTGIAGKLYLTIAAVAASRGWEVGTTLGTGRRPKRFEATSNDLADFVLEVDAQDPGDVKRAQRAITRAAHELQAIQLVTRERRPRHPTAWTIDQYRGRDGTVVPRTLWRNGWITELSGPALAIYLAMLSKGTEKQPRHLGTPPNVRWMMRSELPEFSAPTLRSGLDELLSHRIIHRTDYGRASFFLLLEPGLTLPSGS